MIPNPRVMMTQPIAVEVLTLNEAAMKFLRNPFGHLDQLDKANARTNRMRQLILQFDAPSWDMVYNRAFGYLERARHERERVEADPPRGFSAPAIFTTTN